MRKFYFIGGPKTGQSEEFFWRLAEIGGAPSGWCVYPHASVDGKALYIVGAESPDEIREHLRHFDGIYECSALVEIVEGKS